MSAETAIQWRVLVAPAALWPVGAEVITHQRRSKDIDHPCIHQRGSTRPRTRLDPASIRG